MAEDKKKNHEWYFKNKEEVKEEPILERKDKPAPAPSYVTKMSAPFYICEDINDPKKTVVNISKGTKVFVQSRRNAPWVKIKLTDQRVGFTLETFLEKGE